MEWISCLRYLTLIGVISFFVGRTLPKCWFRGSRFPFRAYRWECDGKAYDVLRIKEWQNLLPDMSRILPWFIPAKRLGDAFENQLPRMIQETCVAELIHLLLCLGGLYCLRLWRGPGGVVIAVLFAVGNLPYILIQRYNRPRLMKLHTRMDKKTIPERQIG